MNKIKNKIKHVMSLVFKVDISELPDNCSFGDFVRWDSLGHMNLIVALEEVFNITFSDDDVLDMLNIDLIYNIILSKNNQSME